MSSRRYSPIPNSNARKRILFIITQSEIGGAQRFLHDLVTHLDQDRYELLVAAGSSNTRYDLLDTLKTDGIKVVKLKHLQREIKPIKDLQALCEIRKLIKSWGPNILFLNSSKAGIIGSLAAKLQTLNSKLKTIYRIGGWSFNDPWPLWKKIMWFKLEWLTALFKDVIIVNNKHDFDQAEKLRIARPNKLRLIYNGIDIQELEKKFLPCEEARDFLLKKSALSDLDHKLHPSERIIRAETPNSKLVLIGTIANFYPPKGLKYLIEAIRLLSYKLKAINYKLIIIGDGPERTKIERQIKDLGLEDSVLLAGQINEALRYLKAFDLFVLPSVKEGFPWAILEAMAASLPVIATSVGAVTEILELRKNGIIVPSHNSKALAKAIDYLLFNQVERHTLGAEAHHTLVSKFSLDKMVSEIEAVL